MEERRKIERKNLAFFTRLFNRETGDLLGHLANLTAIGAMIICETPLESNRCYRIQMELPEPIAGREHLNFEAECLWCRPEQFSPQFHNAGFKFTQISPADLAVIDRIIDLYLLREK